MVYSVCYHLWEQHDTPLCLYRQLKKNHTIIYDLEKRQLRWYYAWRSVYKLSKVATSWYCWSLGCGCFFSNNNWGFSFEEKKYISVSVGIPQKVCWFYNICIHYIIWFYKCVLHRTKRERNYWSHQNTPHPTMIAYQSTMLCCYICVHTQWHVNVEQSKWQHSLLYVHNDLLLYVSYTFTAIDTVGTQYSSQNIWV